MIELNSNFLSFLLLYISFGFTFLILILAFPIHFLSIITKSLKILKLVSQEMKKKTEMDDAEKREFVQEYENELNYNIKKDLSRPHSQEKQIFNILSVLFGYPFLILLIVIAFLANIFYLKNPID